jgi:hypothetical protein
VGEISPYFYVPMFPWKDFLMAQIRKIQKNKKERMEERKRRHCFVMYVEVVPILVCFPSVGNALVRPSLRRIRRSHSNGNLPYNIMLAPMDALFFEMLTFILSCDIKLGIQWVSHENKIK